jgi:F-type H+-transporting ATPase subunit a
MYSPVEAFDISTVVANLPWYFSTFGGYSARTVEQEDLVAINVILMGTPIIWGIKSVGIVILEVLLITYALFFIAQPHSVTLTSGVTRGFEFIFSFIYAQVKTQLGLTNVHFFRLFFLLFLQVLIANYLGLLPFGVSPTSQAVVTAFISLNI